jgi:hypothetical protein
MLHPRDMIINTENPSRKEREYLGDAIVDASTLKRICSQKIRCDHVDSILLLALENTVINIGVSRNAKYILNLTIGF